MERDVIFSKFRPFCAALASKPSKEILEKLDILVSATNPQDLVSLQEYILFPCQLYLKTPMMPENYTIQVLKFVEHFFQVERKYSNILIKVKFLYARRGNVTVQAFLENFDRGR